MRLPLTAVALGVLGLIPFAAAGLFSVTGDAVVAPRGLLALVSYGAIILGFLGGVHWGFAMPVMPGARPMPLAVAPEDRQEAATMAATPRVLLGGVLPSIIGWGAMLLAIYRWDDTAVLVLIAGFIGLIIAESRAHRLGLLPPGYIWLRWSVTAAVLICLVSVVILRLVGGNIVL